MDDNINVSDIGGEAQSAVNTDIAQTGAAQPVSLTKEEPAASAPREFAYSGVTNVQNMRAASAPVQGYGAPYAQQAQYAVPSAPAQGYGAPNVQQSQYAVPNAPAQGYGATYAQHARYAVPSAPVQGYARAQFPQNGAVSASGSASAYPVYNYFKSPKEIERDNIKSAASKGGAMSIAITLTMLLVGVIIGVSAFMTGTFTMESTGGDPYAGFTPLGFYMYEGLASLISMFIPGLIIMNMVRKQEKLKFDDLLPFERIGGKKLTAVVFGGMAVCMIAQMLAALLSYNFSLLGFDVESAIDFTMGTSAFDVIMNSICTAVIPALVEEFAYRGIVLGTLKKYDTNLAIIGSAFLFGMVHGNLGQIPFAFVVGLVLAYVRVKCDSMLPNILIHFGNNFYAVLLSTLEEVAPDEVTVVVESAFMVVLVIAGLIGIYWLSKNEKDFFKIEAKKTELTFGEKLKAFFTTGTVIASTILLCLETIALVQTI